MQNDTARLIHQLISQARQSNHRYLLLVCGERDWCYRYLEQSQVSDGFDQPLWVTDRSLNKQRCLEASKYQQLLGSEADLVVYDAYAGFNPDAFAALSGIVRGGGLQVLLAPPLNKWPDYVDPDYQTLCVHPFRPEQIRGRFLTRLVTLLQEELSLEGGVVSLVQQGNLADEKEAACSVIEKPEEVRFQEPSLHENPLHEQQQLIARIIKVATGHRRRPLVISADRGRGKSAALGFAAAELLKLGKQNIIITAPRVEALVSFFQHAGKTLNIKRTRNALQLGDGCIQFIPPDELLRSKPSADLLMVDEAAGIPLQLLSTLLRSYSRVVFSSTTHGYEGSGRGFTLRFNKILDQLAPQWKEATLKHAIRWSANDPLENFVFQALLLKTDIENLTLPASLAPQDCSVRRVHRDELLSNKALLQQIFGLLVAAHYRTSPADLRKLLDGPNIQVYVMQWEQVVVGACLLAQEGGLEAELVDKIAKGERRVRGHLIPQTLISHVGLPDAASLHCGRIMRIAIHPALQHQGLGKRLIGALTASAREQGFDYLASSFAASPELIDFWRVCGFTALRVGLSREASSAMHSVLVACSLNQQSAHIIEQASAIFWQQFPLMLSDQYRELEAELIESLFHCWGNVGEVELSPHDWQMLQSFAEGQRIYDVCSVAIWKMACQLLADQSPKGDIDPSLKKTLILRVLQHKDWQAVVSQTGLSGRKQITAQLQQVVLNWVRLIEMD